jgi:hypothetical protein
MKIMLVDIAAALFIAIIVFRALSWLSPLFPPDPEANQRTLQGYQAVADLGA